MKTLSVPIPHDTSPKHDASPVHNFNGIQVSMLLQWSLYFDYGCIYIKYYMHVVYLITHYRMICVIRWTR